jgi:hypothetical protein
MLKAKFLTWLVVLVAVAGGVAAIVKTGSVGPFSTRPSGSPKSFPVGQVTPESGVGTGTVGGFADRPHLIPGQPTPVDPALRADQAKSRYKGLLGHFVVTPSGWADSPPCPKPLKAPTRNEIMTSELFSSMFGVPKVDYVPPANFKPHFEVAYACADGTIQSWGTSVVGKRYFVGPAKVAWDAPLDRLKLMTVARSLSEKSCLLQDFSELKSNLFPCPPKSIVLTPRTSC